MFLQRRLHLQCNPREHSVRTFLRASSSAILQLDLLDLADPVIG